MKLSLRQNAEIKRMKTEIAQQYGVEDFEDIDRGKVTSRSNGDIVKTLVEMAERKLPNTNMKM
ncbi:MAG TPA: small, acid-soluble spore protein, alpha/beta type [Anaerovoracaceae bacterium]|nr:small, acid-soluble spore protein, alpha/beta type [Anaerovoracaceae bacterium]